MESLQTLAEVGTTLAGFAGIVAVLGRVEASAWPAIDRELLKAIIVYGLSATIFSLLPFALIEAPLTESERWAGMSCLLAVFLGFRLLFAVRGFVHLSRRSLERVGVIGAIALFVGSGGAFVVQVLNVFGVAFHRSFTGFFLGLLWLIFGAALGFVRLFWIFLRPQPSSPS